MADIPKIARQRLEAMTSPGAHPDPNLLTAFLEKSLAERERQPVVEHLAHCPDCREVVSLSAPPLETAEFAPARAGWLSWPVLRWAAAAACLVVVGTAVTLRFRDKRQMEGFIQERQSTAAVTEKKAELKANKNKDEAPTSMVVVKAEPAQPARAKAAEIAASGMAKSADSDLALRLVPPVSPKSSDVPAAAPPNQLASAAPAPARSAADLADKKAAETVEVTAGAETATTEVAELTPGKAKEALHKSTARNAVDIGAVTYNSSKNAEIDTLSSNLAPLVPRWTLSSDGTLQRSLNGGKSWQAISVASQAKFRALSAFGQEIWVGGSAGALYHSLDAGTHWVQVKPVANGSPLSADIIGVEFTDPQHGKLTTASETWFTGDGGQSWTKQ
jgi:hypothetical protein